MGLGGHQDPIVEMAMTLYSGLLVLATQIDNKTEEKRNIIHQLLEEYDIETVEDIQEALKDLLGGKIKEMMEAEMDNHLGYQKSERSDIDDYRNGYKSKRVNSSYGSMDIDVPQNRKSTFEPQVSNLGFPEPSVQFLRATIPEK